MGVKQSSLFSFKLKVVNYSLLYAKGFVIKNLEIVSSKMVLYVNIFLLIYLSKYYFPSSIKAWLMLEVCALNVNSQSVKSLTNVTHKIFNKFRKINAIF